MKWPASEARLCQFMTSYLSQQVRGFSENVVAASTILDDPVLERLIRIAAQDAVAGERQIPAIPSRAQQDQLAEWTVDSSQNLFAPLCRTLAQMGPLPVLAVKDALLARFPLKEADVKTVVATCLSQVAHEIAQAVGQDSELAETLYSYASGVYGEIGAFDGFTPRDFVGYYRSVHDRTDWKAEADLLDRLQEQQVLRSAPDFMVLRYINGLHLSGRYDELRGDPNFDYLRTTHFADYALLIETELALLAQNEGELAFLEQQWRVPEIEVRDKVRRQVDWAMLFNNRPQPFGSFERLDPSVVPHLDAVHFPADGTRCLVAFETMQMCNVMDVVEQLVEVCHGQNISVVIVRDRRGYGGAAGFGDTFPDLGASYAALSSFLAEHGYTELVTFGQSGGGFLAIDGAGEIGARAVLGMGARTHVPSDEDTIKAFNIRIVWHYLRRVNEAKVPILRDVRGTLRNRHDIYVENHIGRLSTYDQLFVRDFETAANAFLFQDEHDIHNSWEWLIENDLFRGRLDQFLKRVFGPDRS